MNSPAPRPAQAPIADWATLIAKADALGLLSSTPPDDTEPESDIRTSSTRTLR